MNTPLPPVFSRLAGANLAAQSAAQISLAAVPIVAVLALGAGPGEIGALATAQTLPFLLLAMPVGLLADRISKRSLMLLAEALRALALLGWLVAAALDALSIPLLAVLGFLGAAGTVGFTLAAYGVGMVLGALAAPRLLRALPFGQAILLGPAVSVPAATAMLATLAVPTAAMATLSFFLFGVGPIIWTISSTTLRQTVTPAATLGRVTAIFLAANRGARPLGAALGGWVGESFGAQACLWLALTGFVLQALLIAASAMRTLRSLPVAVA